MTHYYLPQPIPYSDFLTSELVSFSAPASHPGRRVTLVVLSPESPLDYDRFCMRTPPRVFGDLDSGRNLGQVIYRPVFRLGL